MVLVAVVVVAITILISIIIATTTTTTTISILAQQNTGQYSNGRRPLFGLGVRMGQEGLDVDIVGGGTSIGQTQFNGTAVLFVVQRCVNGVEEFGVGGGGW